MACSRVTFIIIIIIIYIIIIMSAPEFASLSYPFVPLLASLFLY
jgi:hypothetical protein